MLNDKNNVHNTVVLHRKSYNTVLMSNSKS